MNIYLASGNRHKVAELQALADASRLPIEIRPATDRLWHLDTYGITGLRIFDLEAGAFRDVDLPLSDWQEVGHDVPLLVNLQPAGEYLGEDYHQAGGVPAVVAQLMSRGLIHEDAMTVNGRTIGENCRGATIEDVERSVNEMNRRLAEGDLMPVG